MDYRLEDINDTDFEKMVNTICQKILGTGVIEFSPGKDGGRDGKFTGTAQNFPSRKNCWSGKFIIQAKHTEIINASCSDKEFENRIDDEIVKIQLSKYLKDSYRSAKEPKVWRFWILNPLVLVFFFSLSAAFSQQTIKIGFLVPNKPTEDVFSQAAVDAAHLAIVQANKSTSKNKFELIIRSCDGPWGMGSKESVNLVYEDEVCAIVGSLDGRNAHLAEQVSAKSHLVFLSTRATDPTLSQAYVPWYFRVVPNDNQQAKSLVQEIYKQNPQRKITVITDASYDAKYALKSFVAAINQSNIQTPTQLSIENSPGNIDKVVEGIKEMNSDGIVFLMDTKLAQKIIREIQIASIQKDIYGQVFLLGEGTFLKDILLGSKPLWIVSSKHWKSKKGMAFQEEFSRAYQYTPGSLAAYSYDGISLLIDVINKVGSEKEKIRNYLREFNYEGVTGAIEFDDLGNRKGNYILIGVDDINQKE